MEAVTVTGAVFVVIGALLVGAGLALARNALAFSRHGVRAPGTITGVRWSASTQQASTTSTAFPELRFTLPDGRVVETTSDRGSSADALRQGRTVTVVYDPDDPSRARLDGAGRAMLPSMLLIVGAGCIALGLGLVVAGNALDDALPSVIRS